MILGVYTTVYQVKVEIPISRQYLRAKTLKIWK